MLSRAQVSVFGWQKPAAEAEIPRPISADLPAHASRGRVRRAASPSARDRGLRHRQPDGGTLKACLVEGAATSSSACHPRQAISCARARGCKAKPPDRSGQDAVRRSEINTGAVLNPCAKSPISRGDGDRLPPGIHHLRLHGADVSRANGSGNRLRAGADRRISVRFSPEALSDESFASAQLPIGSMERLRPRP